MNNDRRNVRTREFKALFDRLPEQVRRQAGLAYRAFLLNPDHPALRRHTLKDNDKGRHRKSSISVSINMQYRAIYVEDGDTNIWYWIGNHNDYDNFTGAK